MEIGLGKRTQKERINYIIGQYLMQHISFEMLKLHLEAIEKEGESYCKATVNTVKLIVES